jgi:hypothetical protein
MWASGHGGHIKRAAHGYEPTREAAMAAFAKAEARHRHESPFIGVLLVQAKRSSFGLIFTLPQLPA